MGERLFQGGGGVVGGGWVGGWHWQAYWVLLLTSQGRLVFATLEPSSGSRRSLREGGPGQGESEMKVLVLYARARGEGLDIRGIRGFNSGGK